MTRFQRRLENVSSLQRMAEPEFESNWWQDLLRAWCPAGQPLNEESGQLLRLAVRDNYLSFYHFGQSVAEVSVPHGKPRLKIHRSYALGSADGQEHIYVQFDGSITTDARGSSKIRNYRRGEVRKWIEKAYEWKGKEKHGIEESVIASNPNYLDAEIRIPGGAKQIDIAVVEETDDDQKVVFWEAKRSKDQRLYTGNREKSVVTQISEFAKSLKPMRATEKSRERTAKLVGS